MSFLQGVLSLAGRVLLCVIFLMSTVGKKIPDFKGTAAFMATKGVPLPELMLVGAIVFLLVGSLSVIVGYKARLGALLLAVFLVLATYYFHNFWAIPPEHQQEQQEMMIQFMKNLSMFGAMLFIMANG